MLVKYWMNKSVVTADVNDSMQDALELIKVNNIRRLPVMRDGELAGIVTDKDLLKASPSKTASLAIHELLYLVSRIKVEDIMRRELITISCDYTVQEAAVILLENKISGMPVVDHNNNLAGIITQSDIFRALISISGIEKKGVSFAFQVEDRSGSIQEIADLIREYGGRIGGILTSYERIPKGFRRVYIHSYGIDRAKMQGLIEEFKNETTLFYIIDHKINKREILS